MQEEEVAYKKEKRKVLIILGVAQIVVTLAGVVLGRFEAVSSFIAILSAVGWAVGILAWIKIDAEQRAEDVSSGLRFAIIILGVFALAYYLFKTRGLAGGLKGLGWTLLYFLAFFLVYFVLVVLIFSIFRLTGVVMTPV